VSGTAARRFRICCACPPDLAPIQSGHRLSLLANIEQFRGDRLRQSTCASIRTRDGARRGGAVVKRLVPASSQLILDTRELTVTEVTKRRRVCGARVPRRNAWVGRPFIREKGSIPGEGPGHRTSTGEQGEPSSFASEYETSPPTGLAGRRQEPAGRRQPFSVHPIRNPSEAQLEPADGHSTGTGTLQRHHP